MNNRLLFPILVLLTTVSACDESWQNAFVAAGNNSSLMQYNDPPQYSDIFATPDDDYTDTAVYDSSPAETSGYTPPPSANTSSSGSSSSSDIGPILVEQEQVDWNKDYESRLAESERAFEERKAKQEADAEAKRIRDQEITRQQDAESKARCGTTACVR